MSNDLMEALSRFEAAESNLANAERLWREVVKLMPTGFTFGDNPEYEDRCRALMEMVSGLPAIKQWQPSIELFDWNDISQMRLDAHEVDGEAQIQIENLLYAPAKELREYRFRFDKLRRELTRDALKSKIETVDVLLPNTAEGIDLSNAEMKVSAPSWDQLREEFDAIGVLLGSNPRRPSRWSDLQRHLRFGQVGDFLDIVSMDWPAVKAGLYKDLYRDDEPLPVGVEDLQTVVISKPLGKVITKLAWQHLDAESFERLLFNLISDEPGYENPEWLMKTAAADRGRDLSVFRVTNDNLSGTIRSRVIIQCKHWLSKSISMSDVSELRAQMSLWRDPPIDELIIATSGQFTADAVQWIETENGQRVSPRIGMWPSAHLERLLAARPHLIAEFRLR